MYLLEFASFKHLRAKVVRKTFPVKLIRANVQATISSTYLILNALGHFQLKEN